MPPICTSRRGRGMRAMPTTREPLGKRTGSCEFVTLHVFNVTNYSGRPTGVEGQALRWEPVSSLMQAGLLPADLPIVDALRKMRPDPAVP